MEQMKNDYVWEFLYAIEDLPLIAKQPENLYEIFAAFQKKETRFEVGIDRCFAEGDMPTIETAENRLRGFLLREENAAQSCELEMINGIVHGKDVALAQKKFKEIVCDFVNGALNHIVSIRGESETKKQDTSINTDNHLNQTDGRDTGWYTVDEVCAKYKLPKNNVKDRKWREENGFPTHQSGGAYSKVSFNAAEVEEWLAKGKKL